jgi:hypothetical protein
VDIGDFDADTLCDAYCVEIAYFEQTLYLIELFESSAVLADVDVSVNLLRSAPRRLAPQVNTAELSTALFAV